MYPDVEDDDINELLQLEKQMKKEQRDLRKKYLDEMYN